MESPSARPSTVIFLILFVAVLSVFSSVAEAKSRRPIPPPVISASEAIRLAEVSFMARATAPFPSSGARRTEFLVTQAWYTDTFFTDPADIDRYTYLGEWCWMILFRHPRETSRSYWLAVRPNGRVDFVTRSL